MKFVAKVLMRLVLLLVVAVALGGGYWYWFKDSSWSHFIERDPHGDIYVPDGMIGAPVAVGDFALQFMDRADGVQLQILNGNGELVWRSQPGRAFLAAGGKSAWFHEARGMAFIEESVTSSCRDQTVKSIAPTEEGLRLAGHISCGDGPLPWSIDLTTENETALDLHIQVEQRPEINRVFLVKGSRSEERHYGFGEAFTYFDLKGRKIPIVVSEQGVGRGAEPITTGADITNDGAGGSFRTSYAPMPLWHTSDGESFLVDDANLSHVDMRRDDATILENRGNGFKAVIFDGATPLDRLTNMTARTGRAPLLPENAHSGAILGIQGGPDAVQMAMRKLTPHDTPIAGIWLQDWVGQRRTSFGKQLWWNWTLDKERYPNWEAMRLELSAQNIGLYTYINPFLVDVAERNDGSRNLFQEAKEQDFLVKTREGEVYMIQNTSFSAGILDLTHPGARQFIKDVIKDELLSVGSAGWMADFGEGLPFDGVLHDGSDGMTYHNRYPEEWAKLNREAVEEAGKGDSVTFWMRSAWTGSPQYSGMFWAGDQLVSWDKHDGIKSAITGMLSGGLSGMTINHADIGGYTTITNPIANYHRSKELFLRWTEMAAFNPIFRSHEGNRPAPNHQFHTDSETAEHFARMAKLFVCWKDYRSELLTEATEKGWPVMRHPWLHYPNHEAYMDMDYEQFMVGSDIMVAPVLDPETGVVTVEFADDGWQHIWSGQDHGRGRHTIVAPIGQPAVFVRRGSDVARDMRDCMTIRNLL